MDALAGAALLPDAEYSLVRPRAHWPVVGLSPDAEYSPVRPRAHWPVVGLSPDAERSLALPRARWLVVAAFAGEPDSVQVVALAMPVVQAGPAHLPIELWAAVLPASLCGRWEQLPAAVQMNVAELAAV
jgi:hypothetical protein